MSTMTAVNLSYVSIFTRDVVSLPTFYVEVFGLEEVILQISRYKYKRLLCPRHHISLLVQLVAV